MFNKIKSILISTQGTFCIEAGLWICFAVLTIATSASALTGQIGSSYQIIEEQIDKHF